MLKLLVIVRHHLRTSTVYLHVFHKSGDILQIELVACDLYKIFQLQMYAFKWRLLLRCINHFESD